MKHSKVCIGKHLSDSFPIQNALKQGDALSPLLFNFALEYAIRTTLGPGVYSAPNRNEYWKHKKK
jgi:hypothetical protein